jgi:hypothetical protein
VVALAAQAVARLRGEMSASAPLLARRAWRWMRSLAGGKHPAAYYTRRWDYPILLLPCWLDRRLGGRSAPSFRADLVYSTISGYYFLRLCDNLMDGEITVERELLPAAAFFHSEFHAPYARHFPAAHPFWRTFRAHWFATAEAALRDVELPRIGLAQFRRVSARKTFAAKIPLAAVCLRRGREDLWPRWSAFSDRLACFIQMADDLFDWSADAARARGSTYFLSCAERLRAPGETPTGWIVSRGFRWGLQRCLSWLADLRRRARQLDCPELEGLLEQRHATLVERGAEMTAALASLVPVAAALKELPNVAGRAPLATPSSRRRVRMLPARQRQGGQRQWRRNRI